MLFKSEKKLIIGLHSSHRIDPDGHEHAGLLSVRQVQSGNEPGLERVILWRNGEKSRGEYVQ